MGPARLEAPAQALPRGGGGSQADALRAAARESIALWDGGMDFAALADDIRAEADQYLFLDGQIGQVDARIAALVAERDPAAS